MGEKEDKKKTKNKYCPRFNHWWLIILFEIIAIPLRKKNINLVF